MPIPFAETRNIKMKLKQENIHWVSFRYHPFGVRALITAIQALSSLRRLILKENISVLYGRCTPGGSLAYILSRLTQKPYVLDSFEPHAEAMAESGTWNRASLSFKLLYYLEKQQVKFARATIACVPQMKEYISKKYKVQPQAFFSIPACINFDQFQRNKKRRADLLKELNLQNKIVCVYAGKFGGVYLGQDCFDFFVEAEKYWGEKFRVLLLSKHPREEIDEWIQKSGFDAQKLRHLYIPHSEIAKYIELGDFGITPFKPIPSKRYGSPIKTGEYWAMGLPVIITPNISTDSSLVESEDIGAVIPTLTQEGYQSALQKIDCLLQLAGSERQQDKIRKIAVVERSFSLAHRVYKEVFPPIFHTKHN